MGVPHQTPEAAQDPRKRTRPRARRCPATKEIGDYQKGRAFLGKVALSTAQISEIALIVVLANEIPYCDHVLAASGTCLALLALALRVVFPHP